MSKVNFASMSVDQIDELILEAQRAKLQKIEAKRAEIRDRITKEAAAYGFTLSDLATELKSRSRKHKLTGKFTYRNPSAPSETWSGRGRKPNWLVGQIKAGHALDEFRAA